MMRHDLRTTALAPLAALVACCCSPHGDAALVAESEKAPETASPVSPAPSTPATGDGDEAEEPAEPATGESFSLAVGESATVAGLEVTFARMLGDSRCPENVDCVWAGDATIELALVVEGAEGAEPARVELHTHPDYDTRATYGGFVVELLELSAREPYRARLQVFEQT